jgi:hypothetical protein
VPALVLDPSLAVARRSPGKRYDDGMNLTRRGKLFTLCALGLTVAVHGQTTKLDGFVGKDLRENLHDQQSVERIIGKAPSDGIFGTAVWHVWKARRNGRTRYIVLLVQEEAVIPGGSTACVVLSGASAKKIASWCFPTGWRMTPRNASIDFTNETASELIVIDMSQFVNGSDVAREYFGFSDDRLRLVRIENHGGEAVQNEFVFPNYEIGLVPDAATVEEWARMLESDDKEGVLSALTFLGGRHLADPGRRIGPQESKYADLFQKLMASPRIHELIEDLTKSGNAWVSQAVVLAARGPRERLLR